MRGRWSGDLGRIQEEVNRQVEEMLNRIGTYWHADGEMRPPMDVLETEDNVFIFVELPGVQRDEINIALAGRALTITADKKRPELVDTAVVHGERGFGRYRRTYDMPSEVDLDRVDASLNDGVLRVVLPKVADKAQKIEIKIG